MADHSGLRRLVPEEAIPADVLGRYAWGPFPRPTTVVWALLDPGDAETIRTELGAGRHRDACGLLLNRAVELLPLAAAAPEFAGSRSAEDRLAPLPYPAALFQVRQPFVVGSSPIRLAGRSCGPLGT